MGLIYHGSDILTNQPPLHFFSRFEFVSLSPAKRFTPSYIFIHVSIQMYILITNVEEGGDS